MGHTRGTWGKEEDGNSGAMLLPPGFVVEENSEENFVVEENPQEKVDKEPDCFICQLLVVSVEVSIIRNNATMDGIVQAASSMCDGLGTVGSGIVQQCHE